MDLSKVCEPEYRLFITTKCDTSARTQTQVHLTILSVVNSKKAWIYRKWSDGSLYGE